MEKKLLIDSRNSQNLACPLVSYWFIERIGRLMNFVQKENQFYALAC